MSALKVTLFPLSNIGHLRQVYTGFHILERMGLVKVDYDGGGAARLGVNPTSDLTREAYCLGAEIEGIGLVVYDVHDSDFLVSQAYSRAAIYFKRSYNPGEHAAHARVRPLGLNLGIEDRPSLLAARRAFRFGRGRTKYGDLLRALGVLQRNTIRAADLATLPIPRDDPRVLFLTRVWRPTDYHGVTPAETIERTNINEMRADCVRQLRKTFGERFIGGLVPNEFARENFSDLVVQDAHMVRRHKFIDLMMQCDVCISTRGLLGSTGWKFAEYMATGRAIASEPMPYRATGRLEEGRHYLEFVSADRCVEAVERLFSDRARRGAMMAENLRYYAAFVRPEALILNSLMEAFRLTSGVGGQEAGSLDTLLSG